MSRLSSSRGSPHLSTFRPESVHAFRHGLFHSPEALATLRLEAVDRFLRWREIERGVESVLNGTSSYLPLQTPRIDRVPFSPHIPSRNTPRDLRGKDRAVPGSALLKWDQAQWQSKWESSLSTDVVKTLRRRRGDTARNHDRRPRTLIERRSTVTAYQRPAVPSSPQSLTSSTNTNRYRPTSRNEVQDTDYFPAPDKEQEKDKETIKNDHSPSGMPLDPLHLPSLLAFSWSLLAPLRMRILSFLPFSSSAARSAGGGGGFAVGTILSVFCTGVGLGYLLAGM